MERKHYTEYEEFWHRPWNFIQREDSTKDVQESSETSGSVGQETQEKTLTEGVERTIEVNDQRYDWRSVTVDEATGRARWMLE